MRRSTTLSLSMIAASALLFTLHPFGSQLAALAQDSADPAETTRPSRVPPAENIGKAESCIPINRIRQTKVHDDQTIDFIMTGGKVYRNILPNRCPSLGFEGAFSYSTSITQLCSADIITVIRPGGGGLFSGPSCGLGKFQPVKLTKAEPEPSDKPMVTSAK